MQQRSAQAAPLYEKAFAGGSVAPLETQFQQAFNDTGAQVAQAQKELAAAKSAQILAAAKQTQTTGDVYSTSAANREASSADALVQQAQQKLSQAQSAKQEALSRLQQAQEDGTANAPGAVWSPRIQQFLDDPIMKAGMARGIEIQRLEALAEGSPFNPTEYAITGQDTQGNPIVGAVPNMRTLDAAKRGLDAIIADNTDDMTGRVNQYGRAVTMVNDAFKNQLDAINPDYAQARAAWSGPSRAIDAARLGQKVFSTDADTAAQRVGQMDQSEKAAYQAGVAQAILNKIGQVQDGGKVARMFATPNVRAKVEAAFDSPQDAQSFMDMAERLNEQANARNAIMGNSRTAARQAQQGYDWGAAAAAGHAALAGNPVGAAMNLLRGVPAQGMSDETQMALANLLTNPNAAQVAAAIQAARPGVASRAGNALTGAGARMLGLTPSLLGISGGGMAQ
jgi:hypothetical protein